MGCCSCGHKYQPSGQPANVNVPVSGRYIVTPYIPPQPPPPPTPPPAQNQEEVKVPEKPQG